MNVDSGFLLGDIMGVAEEAWNNPRGRRGGSPHGNMQGRRGQKRRGEIGEAMFLTKAIRMGFSVASLWGDSDRYDLIVDTGERLFRVQVKSAHQVSSSPGGGYNIRAHGHRRKSYQASEIDLLVAYIVPEDAWYVFPPRAFMKMKSLRLFPRPGKKGSKFEKYREAWEWLGTGSRKAKRRGKNKC